MNNFYYDTLFLKESYDLNKKVFHCSKDFTLDGKILKPRVPKYLLKKENREKQKNLGLYEDYKQPRICFAENIQGCLRGMFLNMNFHYNIAFNNKILDSLDLNDNSVLWLIEKYSSKLLNNYPINLAVYIPEKSIYNYKHKTNSDIVKENLVFDASITKECWITEPVKLKFYGILKVIGEKNKHFKKIGKCNFLFFDYDYKWEN